MNETLKDPLALWEQTVCEIRGELRCYNEDNSMSYAIVLCDALENSMVQFARTGVAKNINFENCFNRAEKIGDTI